MATKKEVATTEEDLWGALDTIDMSEYEGAGNENVSSNDIAIPYLNILQKMSPQCDADDSQYIEGSKPGMFFQNVNLYTWTGDEGIEIVPVAYSRHIIEWVPREKGGGMVAIHPQSIMEEVDWEPNEKNIPVRKDNGNLLVDTAQHIVLYRSQFSGKFEPAMISMKSTAHKKSRMWNSLIAQQTIPNTDKQAPRWLYIWEAHTVREQKDDNSWYNWEFRKKQLVDPDTFKKAEKLYKANRQGQVRGAEGADDQGGDIPF